MSTGKYLQYLWRDKYIASITPTSLSCVQQVCRTIDFSHRQVIIEYGPGLGVFTDYLAERLSDDSLLLLIERNDNFSDQLTNKYRTDSRIHVYHDSAEHVQSLLAESGEAQADLVLSGIPFSFFPDQVRDTIVRSTREVLKDDGMFLAYQTFFQRDVHLKIYMERYFSRVRDTYYLRNLPPMRLYEALP
ncbi:class I SAM-dependent methyltransferase [Aneurinibacillus uraniidurans]|uniref:class I SAM-dependent methyltransferase n=1 Tax=Aneurinibacillus uraniidurans TaxID=2966586 RepID=UPI00234B2919|nr:rRNA adenine N-6-methyltransferase family protein [Aneurinibacillus sp. B1]WCN36203.1 rRNA adenine N-6-methyltransferase family protein [Aneurinibacillus sp. B1]